MTSDGHREHDLGNHARIVAITVADHPDAWARAGFTVTGGAVTLGPTMIRLTGDRSEASASDDAAPGERRGILGWSVAGLDAPAGAGAIDGIATTFVAPDTATGPEEQAGPADDEPHPNGATGIDHVVLHTPDLARTTAAFAAVGLAVRRVRETDSYGAPMRQAFLRAGPTVVEVVSGHDDSGEPAEDAPAGWFGLAIDVDDLDAVAASLGDGLGGIKPAVQEGRRIATIRHRQLGLSVAVALMDDRG